MRKPNKFWIDFVRWIGRQVCRVRGHHFFYPGGEVRSWAAYSCVRCGELDRPLDTLPYRPDDDGFDLLDDPDYRQEIDREHAQERRWFSRLPFPHWL